MSAPPEAKGEPITDQRQLIEYVEAGCKPKSDWRIGTEHEKFGYTHDDLRPLPYEGERSVRALLEGLAARFGWQPILEDGRPIALQRGRANITLEPGGQFELSGAPVKTLHETCSEVHEHLDQVKAVAEPLGIGMLGLGFQPKWRRDDIPWMPKGRYRIMRAYMPKKGRLGLDMMLRTCTIQVNLDFASEADMVKKFRVGLALQPVATALFANSPFTEGKPNGFESYRSHIWTDTDPDRSGILPFVFEEAMGFERYVEHALEVPMYFVYRDGRYIDASGQSFRDFLAGRLPALPGESPDADRLERPSDDAVPRGPAQALPRDARRRRRPLAMLMRAAGAVGRRALPRRAARRRLGVDQGLDPRGARLAACRGSQTWPEDAIPGRHGPGSGAADAGACRDWPQRRAEEDWAGQDERQFLTALTGIAETGRTPAEGLLERYHGRWGGSVDPVFSELAY